MVKHTVAKIMAIDWKSTIKNDTTVTLVVFLFRLLAGGHSPDPYVSCLVLMDFSPRPFISSLVQANILHQVERSTSDFLIYWPPKCPQPYAASQQRLSASTNPAVPLPL
jgi:hypothetical protein